MADREEVVADEVQTPEPERSVRDELVASLAEVNARHEQEPVEPSLGSAPADRGDGRTDKGRFAPRSGQESAATSPQPKDPGTQQPAAGPNAGSVSQSAVEPPQGWTAQEKAVWATVPAAAQAAIARREQDFHRRLTEHDEVRSIGNQFMSVANEHAQLIQQRNSTPVALFKEFLGILHRIHTSDAPSRVQLFRQLAQQNGVSLDQPQAPGNQPSPQPQPQFQLPPPVLQTVQEWNQFKARQDQEARDREAQETQQTTNEIESFRSAVDAQGQPLHPHFNTVTTLMASILRGNAATTLEEAYQLAVKAHPETSKALEAAAQAAAKAADDARRKAEAARRKAGSIRSGPGGTPEVTGSKGTVRDDLRAAMESVRGRI